jgi:outer membrane protein OmpA-like peptidoglycan-associated protein
MLKRSDIEGIARNLGEPEQAVSRGMDLSTASIFSAMARKAGESDAMRQVVELASKTPANAVASALTGGQLAGAGSSLVTAGERFLSSLFGGGQGAILNSISRESGLRAAGTATVMALGAQSVLSFLGSRVRDEGMTATGLSEFLRREGANLRSALPAGFNEAFSTEPAPFGVRTTSPAPPTTAQVPPAPRRRIPWLWILPLAAILLGLFWLAMRPKSVTVPNLAANLGNLISISLPDGTSLSVPERGVEGRLLAFIRDPNRAPDSTSWFDFDRLLFDSGSATLQPQSQDQLRSVAAILKAYPNVHMRIGGYTDNTGSPDANVKLSNDRANNVMAELVRLGISPDRLEARGYGPDHPVADNSTEEGRAQNRRISMLVTQK